MLASTMRASAASGSDAEGTSSSTTASSGSSSSTSRAAQLCPSYHAQMLWRAAVGKPLGRLTHRPWDSCLEVLVLREMLGSQPWALQQLQPYSEARPTNSSSTESSAAAAENGLVVGVQWPLLATSTSSSSNSSSSRAACQCRSLTCYLCTPPSPVTLQQLRLVLEVVCLTCAEFSDKALQAPVLLALLLQRASPGVRAAFLNSADGVRLLVALQQSAEQTLPEGTPLTCSSGWCMYDHAGALSTRGVPEARPLLLHAVSRTVYSLAWCYMELGPGSAVGLGAAGSAGSGVRLVTQAAVEKGSIVPCHPASRLNGEQAEHTHGAAANTRLLFCMLP
jgi:hypothetical protein